MEGVSGVIYRKGKPEKTFTADSGYCDSESSLLRLSGNVVVVGEVTEVDPKTGKPTTSKATLTCDRMDSTGGKAMAKAFAQAKPADKNAPKADLAEENSVLIAKGNVRLVDHRGIATGPELWALSDLSWVATPNLFYSPMKNTLWQRMGISPGVVALAAASIAQGPIIVTDAAKPTNLRLQTRSISMDSASENSREMTLTGSVIMTSRVEGLDLRANSVKATIVTDPNTRQDRIQKGVASGAVRLIKTVTTSKGTQSTTITSPAATYLARTSDALVTMNQSVRIVSVNSAKRQNMVATGSKGTAVLELQGKAKKNSLRSAVLTGVVRVEILDRSDPKGQKKIIATGNRLEIDNQATAATLLLTGDVKFAGSGASPMLGTMQGMKWVEFKLNEAGEYQSFRARS